MFAGRNDLAQSIKNSGVLGSSQRQFHPQQTFSWSQARLLTLLLAVVRLQLIILLSHQLFYSLILITNGLGALNQFSTDTTGVLPLLLVIVELLETAARSFCCVDSKITVAKSTWHCISFKRNKHGLVEPDSSLYALFWIYFLLFQNYFLFPALPIIAKIIPE